ncbi:ALDH-like protein [Lophiostoma macrostomum CBS 122681]|uniref:ALDH-like protein n=1 Tax=Lophiostoma macrostomum CBS 122681 TaxID=1314788 RepID=A0A6A6SKL1_9PLEO|nr:ALDH-like protein [Lophiostoma macrostomum CBS 122681]
MSRALQAVREAAIDGRLHSIIYRQTQLEKLHRILVGNVEGVEKAIRRDSGHSDAEAAAEFTLTLKAIRDYYATLDEKASLRCEYALARGEDASGRRDPVGIVYIVPTDYCLFYSVVVAAGAAIAAGNCVIIQLRQLQNTLKEVPSLLRKLLKSALDPSVVDFVPEPASDDDLGPSHIRVFQDSRSASKAQLVVAIVDQGANLEQTAATLVSARFAFGGHSPYAPDIVLVHEFVKKEFLKAVVEAMMRIAVSLSATTSLDQERDTQNTEQKTYRSEILLASYIFAAPKSAKYLSQFVPSQASFVNHVPHELLVGPATPRHTPVDRSLRYPINLFSISHAEYATATMSDAVHEIIRNTDSHYLVKLFKEVAVPLKPQTPRSGGGQIGFFEQGIYIGLGMFGVPTILAIGALGFFGVRFALSSARS